MIRSTLKEKLGPGLDDFVHDLSDFIVQFLKSELLLDFSLNSELGLGYIDEIDAVYYPDPDFSYLDGDFIFLTMADGPLSVIFFKLIHDDSYQKLDKDSLYDLVRIGNYGMDRFSQFLDMKIRKERITIGDEYTLVLKNVKGDLGEVEQFLPSLKHQFGGSDVPKFSP